MKDRLLLYFNIFKALLALQITFRYTSTKPVILHAMFLKANKFRYFCEKVLECFNFNDNEIKLDRPQITRSERVMKGNKKKAISHYIRDDKRVSKIQNGFIGHLANIINAISDCDNMVLLEHNVQDLTEWMGIQYNYNHNS